jgi:hypothetical protein
MTGFASKKASAADKLFDREEAIEYLTDGDFQYIIDGDPSGLELLQSYLEYGFKGYANYTDAELVAEVKERKWMENK